MYENVAKRLRWLAFNFPHTDEPKSESDKICNCINLYCTEAADAIEELQAQNNELLFRCCQDEKLIDFIYQTGKLPSNEPPKEET